LRDVLFVGVLLLMPALLARPSWAQTNPPAPQLRSDGWNFNDPVNIEDFRVFATLWFAWKDTGVMTPEFQAFRWRNSFPGYTGLTPFDGAKQFFKKVYAHRLDTNITSPTYYNIDELLRDDPDVRAAFRRYCTQGLLETPLNDSALLDKHLNAVLDAVGPRHDFVADEDFAVEIENDKLVSFGLQDASEGSPSAQLQSGPTTTLGPGIAAIRRALPTPGPGSTPLRPGWVVPEDLYWPDWFDSNHDVLPWYFSNRVREWFRQKFGHDPADFIWNGIVPASA
jgi:hypothetical protein